MGKKEKAGPDVQMRQTHEAESKVRGRISDNLAPQLEEMDAEETFHGIIRTRRFNNHPRKGITLRVRTRLTLTGEVIDHEWGGKIARNGAENGDWLKEKDEFFGEAETLQDAIGELSAYAPKLGIDSGVVRYCTLFDERKRRTHRIPNVKGEPKRFAPLVLDDDTYLKVNTTRLARRRRVFEIEDPTTGKIKTAEKRARVMSLIVRLGFEDRFDKAFAGLSSERFLIDEGIVVRGSRVLSGVGKKKK